MCQIHQLKTRYIEYGWTLTWSIYQFNILCSANYHCNDKQSILISTRLFLLCMSECKDKIYYIVRKSKRRIQVVAWTDLLRIWHSDRFSCHCIAHTNREAAFCSTRVQNVPSQMLRIVLNKSEHTRLFLKISTTIWHIEGI